MVEISKPNGYCCFGCEHCRVIETKSGKMLVCLKCWKQVGLVKACPENFVFPKNLEPERIEKEFDCNVSIG